MIDNVLLIGNLTLDHNISNGKIYEGPGGSVYFAGKTFQNLGLETTIISPYGKDYLKYVSNNCSIYPTYHLYEKTLVFRNYYLENGIRRQKVANIDMSQYDKILDDINLKDVYKISVVAPIIDNISLNQIESMIKKIPQSLKLLLPQGFFRKIVSKCNITIRDWMDSKKIAKLFDLVVVSSKDHENMDQIALDWSKNGCIVAVTKEEKGCSVYQKGKVSNYGGYIVEDAIDATGAGDIFAAGLGFMFIKTREIGISADFANATAAISLRYHSNQLQYGYSDIISFIKNTKRREII